MLAVTLEAAKNAAIIVVVVLVVLAIAAAWLAKMVVQKVLLALVFGLLAALVWSQRTALEDCADRVRASRAAGAPVDTTCTFLGRDVPIRTSG